jgi:hypothetical protein
MLAERTPWNQFLGSVNVTNSGSGVEFEIAEKKLFFFHVGTTAKSPVSPGNRPASLQGEERAAALPQIIHQVSQKYLYR